MNLTKRYENVKEEWQYRQVELDSYSSLKVFDDSPQKFYRQYILKDLKREDPGKDMILGSLVDVILLGGNIEDKFHICTVSEIDKDANHPSYFAWQLWQLTEACIDGEGNVTRSFQSLAEEAFSLSKYDRNGEEIRFKKKELGYVIEKFEGTNYEIWYKEKRASYGKPVVNMEDVANAEKVANELRQWEFTRELFSIQTGNRYTVHDQLITFFHYEGIDLKCMIDKVIIDHEQKTISLYDLKVTWDILEFERQYLNKYYYIQGAVYWYGIENWMKENLPNWQVYTIIPMEFIVAHSLSFYKPHLWPTNHRDLQAAIKGFRLKNGYWYRGLNEIVADLQWALETGIFTIRRDIYQNQGKGKFEIAYDKVGNLESV